MQDNLQKNNTFNLRKDVIDSNGFTFKSINPDIASINNGEIIANNSGFTTIVVSHNTSGKTANIYVEVLDKNSDSVIDVKSDNDFNIALKSDGSIWSWGANSCGQLALGDTENRNEPKQIELSSKVRQIATGDSHIVILTKDNKVLTSGLNSQGQLGNSSTSNSTTLVSVVDEYGKEISNIAEITAYKNATYLLDYDGNVYACGEGYGKVAVKISNIENVTKVSGNYGITVDNKAINLETKAVVSGLENVIDISSGENHTVFLTKDKTAYALGTNTNGQCGNGTKVNCLVPTIIKNSTGTETLTNIRQIKAGNNFTMAVLDNGEVYTWGSNDQNKLGTDQSNDQVLPKKNTNISNGILVSAGKNHAIYVNSNGKVYAWGNGLNGTLGNCVNANSITPVLVGAEDIVVNTNHLTLRKSEKATLSANVKSFNLKNEVTSDGLTYLSNDKQIIKVDSQTGEVTGLSEGTTSVTVSQDGTDNKAIIQVSVIKSGALVKPMTITVNSTQVILKADGTVWSYGLNANGELGTGTKVDNDNLAQVKFGTNAKIVEISAGENHVLALDENGIVWAWGNNNYYQLGNNVVSNSSEPIKVDLAEKIVKISAGYNSSFAITESNNLVVWGLNTNGELGIGNYENRKLPTSVENIKNVLDVKAGKSHAILVTTDGFVYTTGNNSFGSLTGTEYKRNIFEKVESLENVAFISAGEYHNLALTTSRKLYSWGYNVYGQLGINTVETINTPTQILNISGIMDISAGKSHSMILTKGGNVYATGLNSLGQLGNGTKDYNKEFKLLNTINDVNYITAGNTYSMFIKNDGSVWACGDYYHGLSTMRTSSNSVYPVQVGKQSFSLKENDVFVNIENTKQIELNSQFEFNVFKDNVSNSDYKYESLNNDIAGVDDNGIVTGKNIGVTWIKVTENNTNDVQICIVRVGEKDNKNAPKTFAGNNYAITLKADGSIWSYGYNSNGELGNSSLESSNIPKEINILKSYKDISVGNQYTLALRSDGTVWSFGDNSYGQLGLGNKSSYTTPTLISSISDVSKISAGYNHAVALNKYGEVYVWGSNSNGQLGLGNIKTTDEPIKLNIPGTKIVDISAGKDYTALIDNKGRVYISGNTTNIVGVNYENFAVIKDFVDIIKVACGDELVGINKDGNVVKINNNNISTIYAGKDVVDISAKAGNYMILTNEGKAYVWGENANGELGTKNNTAVASPTPVNIDKNVISVGAGVNNTYVITADGLVYGSGLNTYGTLGNETNINSNEYILVGKQEFDINPDNVLMSVNDIQEFKISSERFNVLKQDLKNVDDFEWKSNNTNIVTIEENAKIKAIAEGETTITVTSKDSNISKDVVVVVEPLDAQRINKISVNGITASIVGAKKYEVTIATDENEGNLLITTKDENDKISINGGNIWYEKGTLIDTVKLVDAKTEIPIKVETANGTQFDYTLTVIKQSVNVDLEHLYVNGIEATSVNSNEYSVILEDCETANVDAITTSAVSKVGIDGDAEVIHEATKDISIKDNLVKTVPIKVISESGKEITYVLTIYKKSAVTDLESVKVDGVDASKNNFLEYSIVVDKDKTEVEVNASALYELAGININKIGEEIKESTRRIKLTGDITTVKIVVSYDGQEKEYTLNIHKTKDGSSLGLLYVNGKEIEMSENNTYEVTVTANAVEAEVLAIASVETSKVQIATNTAEIGRSQVKVDLPELVNQFNITVTDSNNVENVQNYTLIIRKPSTDNILKEIIVANDDMSVKATRVEGTNIYTAKVNEKYKDMVITAIANYKLAEVAIDTHEYIIEKDSLNINFESDTYSVPIKVKAQDGSIGKYTLVLEKASSDTTLEFVKVNELSATLSTTKENTYEVTLNSKVSEVSINAKTTNEFAQIAINNIAYEVNEITKNVAMDSKDITVKINVKAEDGTEKTYDLIIYGLPDNTKLSKITVNGIEAIQVPYTNRYQAKVAKSAKDFAVSAIADDNLAEVKIGNFASGIGSSTNTVNKDEANNITTVNVNITAQDGVTNEDYILEVGQMSDDAELSYIKVDGRGIYLQDDKDGQYKKGDICESCGIELTDFITMLDCKLILTVPSVNVYKNSYNYCTDTYTLSVSDTDSGYTLFEFITSIVWELSFFGCPCSIDEQAQELCDMVESIKNGEEELIEFTKDSEFYFDENKYAQEKYLKKIDWLKEQIKNAEKDRKYWETNPDNIEIRNHIDMYIKEKNDEIERMEELLKKTVNDSYTPPVWME